MSTEPNERQGEERSAPAESTPKVDENAQASPSPEASPSERIAALEKEVSELKDQYLRKLADYENFRKRMFREKEEAIQFANTSLLVDLVQVLDDFDRAIRSSESSQDFKTLHDGIQMIERQFFGLLESKYRLKRFDSTGTPFDPNRHEAIAVEKSDDPACVEDVVVEEFLKGYELADRIIRSAKVKVRQPADPSNYARTEGNTDSGEPERT
jgi:molecular chaperone GrpE